MAQGSIRKRITKDGEVRYNAMYRDPSGKQRTITKGTKKEAEDALREIMRDMRRGTYQEMTVMTFCQCADEWLETQAPGLRPNSFLNLKEILNARILPILGSYPISAINTKMILKVQEGFVGKSGSYLKEALRILSGIMKYAIKEGHAVKNPLDGWKRPKSIKKPKTKILLPREIDSLLEVVQNFTGYVKGRSIRGKVWGTAFTPEYLKWRKLTVGLFYKFIIYTGLRPSEVCALKWPDIDLDRRTVSVSKSLDFFKTKESRGAHPTAWIIQDPKTQAGHRTVPLTKGLVKDLQILKIEAPINPWDFVFTAAEGGPISEEHFHKRHFKKDLRMASIEPMHLYNLRHTYVSFLIAQGERDINKIKYLMGHDDIRTTYNIYVQLLPQDMTEVADRMEAFVKDYPSVATPWQQNRTKQVKANETELKSPLVLHIRK